MEIEWTNLKQQRAIEKQLYITTINEKNNGRNKTIKKRDNELKITRSE